MKAEIHVISMFCPQLRRVVTCLVCAAVLTGSTGCTGDSEEAQDPPAKPSAAPAPPSAPMTVKVATVSGRLAKPARSAVRHTVVKPVAAYIDAAFLGNYPRTDFDDAFDSFSDGAAHTARRDRDLLTNFDLGASTVSVGMEQRQLLLSVLAPNGSAAGATARIRVVYVVDQGEAGETRVTIAGRLLLSAKRSGEWEIFGYDLARSAVPTTKEDR